MKIFSKIPVIIIFLLSIININAFSQFYNGHQMNFGKNRVQYDKFEWYYYRYDRFDTYFYLGGNELAIATDTIVNSCLNEFETFFGQKLSKRIIFVLYQNLSDFRQSNIGLKTIGNESNLGGVIKISDNIVFIYNEGSIEKFRTSIREVVAEMILQEMIFGSNIRSKVANNALISVPDWYINGLASFVASTWDNYDDNNTKNILSKFKLRDLSYLLSDRDNTTIGKSIWNYISIIYGKKMIPNLVYLTRVTKNVENGFLYVLGTPYLNFQNNWLNFYKTQYKDFNLQAEDPNATMINKKSKKNVEYYQIVNNSNSQKIAWAENNLGRYKIKVYDRNTKKESCIFRREHRLEQIIDYSYPILRWHPSGKMLGFIIEKKGKIFLMSYNFEDKKITEREIASVEKITAFDYSNDGQYVVFSAFDNGQSDIFLFDMAANSISNLTLDTYDDENPSFINNTNKIIYASNKKLDTFSPNKENSKNTDIFIYDIKNKTTEQITNTETISEKNPFFFNNSYIYLSDKNGIYNLYSSKIDSNINFIDTITHYYKFLSTKQLTNYKYNISDFSLDRFSNENSFIYKNNNKFSLYFNSELPQNSTTSNNTMNRDLFEKRFSNDNLESSSIKTNKDTNKVITPSNPLEETVNINNYQFTSKALESNEIIKEAVNQNNNNTAITQEKNRLHRYFTTFYTNHLLAQIDMGFLNNSYQKFTGSGYYFNPGFNLITSVSTYDLFEDYRISAAARFAGNFDSNEYLFTYESLKRRWNKQIVLHRQVLKEINGNNYQIKTSTHEIFYVMRYPFSQVNAVQFTANLRMDRTAYSALDLPSLIEKNNYEYWGSFKTEYIFDNIKLISKNIPSGNKIKVFGEFFNMLNKRKTDLFVIGADVRYYLPIYKNFIFATRLGISYSFGHSKLIYYLGAIDNWINISQKIPTFDKDTPIDPVINYQYQAVATNIRGFSQNIRNGSNFAVLNAELRLPIISLLYPRPINNSFLRDFQIIAFFDIGSAWNGLHPFLNNNAYQNDIYDYNSISVIIFNNNYPIVSGYGFGVRSSIFGYFIRADYAWGINNNNLLSPIFYLSLGMDF